MQYIIKQNMQSSTLINEIEWIKYIKWMNIIAKS